VTAAYGFDANALGTRSGRLRSVVAAVELHIEQGPTLERTGREVAAVAGCLGVRRSRITFEGEPGHAGTIAMPDRHDPVRTAAAFVTELFALAEQEDGFATTGEIEAEPAFVTAVPQRCRISLDMRHADARALDRLSTSARKLLEAGRCPASVTELHRQDPVHFDAGLIDAAVQASDGGPPLTSGPLHDSASLALAGIRTVMLFTSSKSGVSHCRDEDTPEAHLRRGLLALHRLIVTLLEPART
jgi:N-carbamoyl-L-amino-acid hydrolase